MNDFSEENSDPESVLLISLLKGVIYADSKPKLFQSLLNKQNKVKEFMKKIGLDLLIAEDEGYAWLKRIDDDEDNSHNIPSLISKRPLSYPVSLILALMRSRLVEHDTHSTQTRLILSRDEIIDMVNTFFPQVTDQVKFVSQIDSYLNKIIELGFLRRLKTEKNKFEVMRIIKAFVNAQWLDELDSRLKVLNEQ